MQEATQNIEPLLDAKEFQRAMKCSLPFIYKLAHQGRIPCIKVPCPGSGIREGLEKQDKKPRKEKELLRFRRGDVIDFIERHYRR